MKALQYNPWRNWKYFINLIPVSLVLIGNLNGSYYSLLNFAFTFVILGMAELLLPENKSNVAGADNVVPDLLMLLVVLSQFVAIGSLIYGVYNGILTGYWVLAAALSTGTAAGSLGIVTAHELIHKKDRFWNFLGRVLLFSVFNPYFYVHHLRVHHKSVGTVADPVTARAGETFYAYLLRSFSGQISQSLALEKSRLQQSGRWSYGMHNYVVAVFAGMLLVLGLLWCFLSFYVALAVLLQAVLANILLEYTNYIEHYGLSRAEKERVNEMHSWQSDRIVSRYFLIDLSRHADHHFHAAKPFNTLVSYEKSPVLPGGYSSMFLPALVPPLWFKIVDPHLPV
ncbi:MAG: alkane 1-monooxygenase [Sphingobacteriaceae bacterium]